MSFREQVADEVKASAENRNNGSEEREELKQIEVDLSETPFVKFNPTTLPTFTFPDAEEGNPIILFKNNQRLSDLGDAANNDQGRDLRLLSTRYLGLVVDDIGAVTDEDEGMGGVFILETENDRTDYRVFDENDKDTSVEPRFTKNDDGEVVENGVEVTYGSRTYKGNKVDEIPGRSILVVDRTAATSVARTLDIRGGPTAGMDEDGQVNDGLIEYFPEDTDRDYPDRGRYARPFVELRPDLAGARTGIMVTRRSEVDDDFAEEIANDDNRNDMLWYSAFDMESGEALERGDYGEPVVGAYLEERFDSEAGRLPDEDWDFVQQYVEAGMPDDEESILDQIEERSGQLSDSPNTDKMVRLIQNGAGAE